MNKIEQLILDEGIKFSQGVSGDGRPLKWTIDLRELLLSPKGTIITEEIIKRLKKFKSRYIGGITMASSLITGQVSYLSDYKGFFIRYRPKAHGLRKEIEGEFDPCKPVVIVDDVINDKGFVFEAIRRIEANEGSVEGVVAIVDYCNDGLLKLKKKGLKIEYLCNLKDIYLIDDKIKTIKIKPLKKENIDLPQIADIMTEPFARDNIYVGGSIGARAGVFYAIKDDKIIWKHKVKANVRCKPFVSDNVYFGCDDMHIRCFTKEGKLLWKLNCEKKLRGGIIVVGDNIYAGTKDGYLICIQDKKIIWEKKIGNEIALPLTSKKGILYVATDKRLFCFDDKNIRWIYNGNVEEFDCNIVKIKDWFRIEG